MTISGLFLRMIIFLLFQVFFSSFATFTSSDDTILFSLPDRDVTIQEYNRFLGKQDLEYSQVNFDNFLQSFIDYHLKLAQGRQQKLDRSIEFVNELTDYRISLAKPYLTHQVKRAFYIQQAYERLQYEINVDHILIKMDNDYPDDTLKYYEKAMVIRDYHLADTGTAEHNSVNNLNREYNFHNLGYLTAFQTEYKFESIAYQLNPGEISIPVRTRLGYHIIRAKDKRTIDNLPPFHLLEDKIFESIEKADDERIQAINKAFTEQLKEYWDFKENIAELERYSQQLNHQSFAKDVSLPLPENQNEVLCSIDGKFLTVKDFWRFMDNAKDDDESVILNKSIKNQIDYFYSQFVAHRLFLYENYMLEHKYPEFKIQLTEYRDAMMLLAATQKNVWEKSSVQDELNPEELMDTWLEELRKSIIVELNTEAISHLKQEWVSSK